MKKKCTNSRCRRVFDTALLAEGKCPFCGQNYPRLCTGTTPHPDIEQKYHVILESYDEKRVPALIRALVALIGRRETLLALQPGALPATIAEDLPLEQTRHMLATLRALGCRVRSVHRRYV